MILISLVAFKAFELIYLSFIKNEAAHATSEWQCLHHVLVHLAMIHSHTAPHSDFLKMFINHRPHLTISYIYIYAYDFVCISFSYANQFDILI